VIPESKDFALALKYGIILYIVGFILNKKKSRVQSGRKILPNYDSNYDIGNRIKNGILISARLK
jgi:hypothetical protein